MPPLQAALPRAHYVDPARWRTERDQVLSACWTCVARLTDLGLASLEPAAAGAPTTSVRAVVDVLGESVVVTRDREGGLHGFFNVCRHRGSQVVPIDDSLTPPPPCAAESLRCPYHSWTYGLDGRLLRAPHTADVEDFDPARFSLHRVGVAEWGGFLWVTLDPSAAAPLLEELGAVPERVRRYPLDRLLVGAALTYDVRANWKVVAENYNECYHCGPVHPELVRLVPAFAGGGQALDWDNGVPHREGAWTFTLSGTSDRAPFPDLDDDERVRHKGELVYPNLLLSLSADHVAAFVLTSRAVDRTTIECLLLFAPEEIERAAFDPSDAVELWDLVNRQDWAICESVQRGMSSRAYREGWYAPMEDASLDIRRWLLPRVGEGDDA